LTALSEREREACKLQLGFADRLKQSPYYLKEVEKNLGILDSQIYLPTSNLPQHDLNFLCRHSYPADILRYSDKYKPTAKKRPPLETAPLDQKFFPKEIWEDFFAAEKGVFLFNSYLFVLCT
jgi:DNA-directed RNA polymerase III subunit RPC7